MLLGLGPRSHSLNWLATLLMLLTFGLCCCSLLATYSGASFHACWNWFEVQARPLTQVFSLGIDVDFVAAVMLCMVSLVSLLVYCYAIPYLRETPGRQRYLAYLSVFVGAMLWLVVADNWVGIFIGWEWIGLASYLCIGLGYQQAEAAKASTQAWLINKLGSILLLVGLLLIKKELGSLSLTTLSGITPATYYANRWLTVAGVCLLGAVFTKSAQFPFFSWLPSAMAAPTPASALLHAATLVSAGVYLLIRLAPVLNTALLTVVAFIGSITAIMGAYAALAQQHIKRMLAYSTISQLGYMMMAIGVGASSAGLLHLISHAFFKACLFLCAGAISYYLSQQGVQGAATQHMPKMGGLRRDIPWVFRAYLVASLGLVGVPGFSGFASKEAILAYTLSWAMEQAQASYYLSYLIPILGFAAAMLTIVYISRSCWLVFMRAPQWKNPSALASSISASSTIPLRMQLSILLLALCSLSLRYHPLSFNPSHHWLWQRLAAAVGSPTTLSLGIQQAATTISILTLVTGMLVGVMSLRPVGARLPRYCSSLTRLSLAGWYLDRLTSLVAQQVLRLSKLISVLEQKLIIGATNQLAVSYVVIGHIVAWLDNNLVEGMVSLVTSVCQWLGKLYGYVQNGNLQHYFWWTCLGMGLLWWWLY